MTAKEKKENLDSLWRGIEVQEKVARGLQLLETLPGPELAHLLRHHDEETVLWREVEQRDCVDRFLGSASQLAVAAIAGYIAAKPEGPIARRLGKVLSGEALRRYYEEHYKLLLPQLLRVACTEGLRLPQENREQSWGAFQWFWRMAMRFQDDPDLWSFLWLLDGGSFGSFGIQDFYKGVEDPKTALGGLGKAPELRTPLETCTIGMVRFFEFSKELGDGLVQMQATPLTASAIWFHYAYWYKEYAQLEAHSKALLAVMQRWVESTQLGVSGLREAEEDMERIAQRIRELSSGQYSAALVDALNSKV